jgi:predicted GIY-YIG superfamily endonuclease
VSTFDAAIDVKKGFSKIRKEKSHLEKTSNGSHLTSLGFQLAFRNAQNLRRRLINKEAKREDDPAGPSRGFQRCKERCVFCRDVKDEETVKKIPEVFWRDLRDSDPRKNRLRNITVPTCVCETKNLVYFSGCVTCGSFYIGETGDTFNRRCSKHRSQKADREKFLKEGPHKDWSELRRHFAEKDHRDAFWVAPLEVLKPEAPERHRKKREQLWIRKLAPDLNIRLTQRADRPASKGRAGSVSPSGSPSASPTLRRKLGIRAVSPNVGP